MKVYDATSIRNVAVVGHGGCGKTQLVSAMLFVAERSTASGSRRRDDRHRLRRRRDRPQAHALLQPRPRRVAETKINIIDTPGFANFLTDARAALRVVEAALVVVDAVAGVEVQTEKLWAEAARWTCRASSWSTGSSAIARASSARSSRCTAIAPARSSRFSCPLARKQAFTGVVDLVRMKAQTFAGERQGDRRGDPGGAGRRGPAGARAADRDGRRGRRAADGDVLRRRARSRRNSSWRVCDRRRSRQAVPARVHLRACTSSASAAARCHRQLRARRPPSATSRPSTGRRARRRVKASDSAPYSAFVWKTIADPFAGRITMLRVVSAR